MIHSTSNLRHFSRYLNLHKQYSTQQGLNWIPPDLSSPTSAFRSATCNLRSTTLKYRSGTFLLGSFTVKHGILTVRWIYVSAQQQAEII